jgi:hypothetical protein
MTSSNISFKCEECDTSFNSQQGLELENMPTTREKVIVGNDKKYMQKSNE